MVGSVSGVCGKSLGSVRELHRKCWWKLFWKCFGVRNCAQTLVKHLAKMFERSVRGGQDSATGTRSRVARVRAGYSNQPDYSGDVKGTVTIVEADLNLASVCL